MKRLSLSEFIEKSDIVHNKKYDYSQSEYVNNYTKIKIICPDHGPFLQTPTDHLSGHGCSQCGGTMRSTTNIFIKKAIVKHGKQYDYLETDYKNAFTPVKIKCKKHGIFLQIPNAHLNGHGCPKCYGAIKLTTSEFIFRAKKMHENKYDYSKSNYISTHKKIEIMCRDHGSFHQRPSAHLRGMGCPRCAGNKIYTVNSFMDAAMKIHRGRYDYSLVTTYNGNKNKVPIICHRHGPFNQRPNEHLLGQGCPRCNISLAETKIINFLNNHNIKFVFQQTFNDCRNPKTNGKLKFDFYIPSENLLVEYDGEQHFKSGGLMKGKHIITKSELTEMQFRDKIRNAYAKQNKINLLRIKYTKLNQIEDILKKQLTIL